MSVKIMFISLISTCFVWSLVSSATQASNASSSLTELREEVREIKALLLQLSEKFDQKAKGSERRKSEGVNGMTSRCTSLCESKAKSLLNETSERFKKHLDVCLNNATRKAFNACDPDPCVNGGSCESISNGSDFRCNDCPIIWSGDKCQNLSCFQNDTGNCFLREDTVYFVHNLFASWEVAKERCAGEGMSLAQPKDQERAEYLSRELRNSYGGSSGAWLGLRSPASDRKFEWEDGSALGAYTGGLDLNKIPADYPCVNFNLRDVQPQHLWDVSKCDYNLFPVCEKRISAN